MKQLFSELYGFVIFDPVVLEDYLKNNCLNNNDILSYFTESEHGDIVTRLGIIIPIFNLPPDYYSFEVGSNNHIMNALKVSDGWLIKTVSGELKIIGLGYLKDKKTISNAPSVVVNLKKGYYNVCITSFYKSETIPSFILTFNSSCSNPQFKGDIETDYGFDD